jgi:hypothetical protein
MSSVTCKCKSNNMWAIGDEILAVSAADRKLVFSSVIALPHRLNAQYVIIELINKKFCLKVVNSFYSIREFIHVWTESGRELRLTASHLLPICESLFYIDNM